MENNLPQGIYTGKSSPVKSVQEEKTSGSNAEERKERTRGRKHPAVSVAKWTFFNILLMIPFVNLIECAYCIFVSRDRTLKSWGKGAIAASVILTLMVTFAVIRIQNMTYADLAGLFESFQ